MTDIFDEVEQFFFDADKYERQMHGDSSFFDLDFHDFYTFNPDMALNLLESPRLRLQLLEVVSRKPIRVKNLIQTTDIRQIEATHINQLIQIEGVAVAASIPEPIPTTAIFTCPSCGTPLEVEQTGFILEQPKKCGCGCRRGFVLDLNNTTYINIQIVTLQERPEELPPGEIPEPLKCVLRDSLIRTISPGDRVKIVGTVRVEPIKPKKLEFIKVIEVNSVSVQNKNHIEQQLTEQERKDIVELSKNPNIQNILIQSFTPRIYGWEHIKESILYLLFSGVAKKQWGSDIRGNINMLLVGDPGTSKSQFLRFAHKLSGRGVFTTGRGATGVGLTAALVKEGERFVLVAGSMVMSDMGVCCIDEGEKMNREDREAIHTPMEDQIVPITKGGIIATLNARCATLMACNPKDGRYNEYLTVTQNLKDFPDTLVSRFDLIYVMPDKVDKERDFLISQRILNLENRDVSDIISVDLLRKYIAYSKHITPTVPEEIKQFFQTQFLEKRGEQSEDSGIQVTWRQLESLIRLSEARARMHLRDTVTMEDAERIFWLFTFYLNGTWRDPYTGKIDIGPMEGIPPDSLSKQAEALPSFIMYLCETGKGDTDLQGWFIMRGDLVDEMTEGGDIDKRRANDIIEIATQRDLVWFSTYNKVRAP